MRVSCIVPMPQKDYLMRLPDRQRSPMPESVLASKLHVSSGGAFIVGSDVVCLG